jgi:5-methylcytosine-specific restriction protein A
MGLKASLPSLRPAGMAIAAAPPKKVDPYYLTPAWRLLREQVFERDRHRCTEPGCSAPAVVCDHILSRRQGGQDTVGNLRSLCRRHDGVHREQPDGRRK